MEHLNFVMSFLDNFPYNTSRDLSLDLNANMLGASLTISGGRRFHSAQVLGNKENYNRIKEN